MKKITKAVLGTAAAAATGYYLMADLIDKLLVDRRYAVPQSFSDKVSGADISSLAELCETRNGLKATDMKSIRFNPTGVRSLSDT